MKKLHVVLSIGSFAVASTLAYIVFADRPSSTQRTDTPSAAEVGLPNFLAPPASSHGAVPGPQALGVTASMASAVATAEDLKKFADEAMKYPNKGGMAYAMGAISSCAGHSEYIARMRAKAPALAAGKDGTRRLAAIEDLERRCRGFSEYEPSMHLYRQGLERGDVVLVTVKRVTEAKGRSLDEQVQIAKEALALKDPQVLSQMKSFAAVPSSNPKQGSVSYFDGRPYGGLGAADYYAAWEAAMCSFGKDCTSPREWAVVQACLQEGICVANALELIKSEYANQPARWEKVTALAARITQVVNDGDVQAFLPPKSRKAT